MILCVLLAPPENGRFRNPLRLNYGSTITVECNEGYVLAGENNLHCVDEDNNGAGEWDTSLPTCQC